MDLRVSLVQALGESPNCSPRAETSRFRSRFKWESSGMCEREGWAEEMGELQGDRWIKVQVGRGDSRAGECTSMGNEGTEGMGREGDGWDGGMVRQRSKQCLQPKLVGH